MKQRTTSDGLRITKVGLWFVLLTLIVLLAASNTGNNGLYLVLAVMLGALLISHLLAQLNTRRLEIELEPPDEIFANRPASFRFGVENRSVWLPRWLLIVDIETRQPKAKGKRRRRGSSWLIPFLAPKSKAQGQLDLFWRRRGLRQMGSTHVSSLFPLGFFRKGRHHTTTLEVLVFPEIFDLSLSLEEQVGKTGDAPSRRYGSGQELLSLRPFRSGDDPRGIHWKQSARTGQIIFKEHESDEARRLSIVFDNAVGRLVEAAAKARFERLVSEAATVAIDYLERGYEVALLTRDLTLPFGGGYRQRWAILEALALIAARDREEQPLQPYGLNQPHLHLTMDNEAVAS